jgi:hypothetical protein
VWLSSHFAGAPHFTTTNVMPVQRSRCEADFSYEKFGTGCNVRGQLPPLCRNI